MVIVDILSMTLLLWTALGSERLLGRLLGTYGLVLYLSLLGIGSGGDQFQSTNRLATLLFLILGTLLCAVVLSARADTKTTDQGEHDESME